MNIVLLGIPFITITLQSFSEEAKEVLYTMKTAQNIWIFKCGIPHVILDTETKDLMMQ
jgi:hypothetical protein